MLDKVLNKSLIMEVCQRPSQYFVKLWFVVNSLGGFSFFNYTRAKTKRLNGWTRLFLMIINQLGQKFQLTQKKKPRWGGHQSFHVIYFFLYPRKHQKTLVLSFSDVFRGCRKRTVARKWLKDCFLNEICIILVLNTFHNLDVWQVHDLWQIWKLSMPNHRDIHYLDSPNCNQSILAPIAQLHFCAIKKN